ncbi:MAG: AlpA family phage regulatory protein [Gammaproteobacteria bacterium]|nr:AlpA family phage regulatory protein [Gammaproteobacteria bacterium]
MKNPIHPALSPESLLSVKEVAALLNRSVSFVYYKTQEGSQYHDDSFPSKIRIGDRAVGYRYQDILDWIESRRVMGEPS